MFKYFEDQNGIQFVIEGDFNTTDNIVYNLVDANIASGGIAP